MDQLIPVAGPSQDAFNTLSDQISSFIKCEAVSMGSTGSVASNTNKTLTKAVSDVITSGYKALAVLPGYPGDDQFVFQETRILNDNITVTIRNVSSAADSGTPTVFLLSCKNNL